MLFDSKDGSVPWEFKGTKLSGSAVSGTVLAPTIFEALQGIEKLFNHPTELNGVLTKWKERWNSLEVWPKDNPTSTARVRWSKEEVDKVVKPVMTMPDPPKAAATVTAIPPPPPIRVPPTVTRRSIAAMFKIREA